MTPLERYAAPARLRPGTWRPVSGTLLILLIWFAWTAVCGTAVVVAGLMQGDAVPDAVGRLQTLMEGQTPETVVFMLISFFGIWPGVWLALISVHGQNFVSVLGEPGRRLPLGDLLRGLLLGAVFFGVSLGGVTLLVGLPERTDLAVSDWSGWVTPIVLLTFVQAGGEELIFRGYLLQQLAARSRSIVVWGVLPSLLFGALHFNPGLPTEMMAAYIFTTFSIGMTAAILVARTGSIAAAIGLHVANNIPGLSLIGIEGLLSGSHLWSYPADAGFRLIASDLISSALLLVTVAALWPQRR